MREVTRVDSVIYEDTPLYDVWLKAIMVLPVFFIIFGVYYLIAAEVGAAIGMFATTLLMGATYWAVLPRKYQILDSKIRIVLGGTFSLNIPFENLGIARVPRGVSLGINFVTTFLSRHAVEIVRKKGMNVNITPGDRDLFLDNLNTAVRDWRRSNIAK